MCRSPSSSTNRSSACQSSRGRTRINLSTGQGFYGIYPRARRHNHWIDQSRLLRPENFDADAVLKQLTERGIKGNIRLRGDTKELYFTDADGIRVQLQDVS